MLRIDGIVFDPPAGLEPTETMITLMAPPAPAPAEGAPRGPRAVRPNLILQSRPARPGADVATLAGETMAELSQSVGGMSNLSSVPFGFDDGAAGVLLAYDFPMGPAGAGHGRPAAPEKAAAEKAAPAAPPSGVAAIAMRQYHVLRLDEGRLTTLTLTVGTADLTPALGEGYLRSLASARRVDAPRKAK